MALPINIKALITNSVIESERIEFKEGWNPQAILHTICAFANDFNNMGGGYIVIGIGEAKGQAILPPKGIPLAQIDTIQKELLQICHSISPNYFPVVEPTIFEKKHILTIWVPPGDVRPYKAPKALNDKNNKIFYIRRMSSTVQAKDADLVRLMELTAKVPFDNRTNQHASLDDLSLTHIASFLREVKSALYEEIPTMPFTELCQNMQIVRGTNEDIRPLNVGLLMFSDKPEQFFRGARIELIEYHDAVGDRFTETIFTGPIYLQLRDALKYLQHQVIREGVQKVRDQAESNRFYNYPYEALEEALANAVYHRSYEKQNPIEINIRPDCIEILSFPGPLAPVDQAMLNKPRIIARDYRNSRLGDFLKELELTEGRGTGIPKIRHFMRKNGSPEPVFETDANCSYFLTTLYPHPLTIQEQLTYEEATGEVPGKYRGSTGEVSEEVQRLILAIEGNMKRTEIQRALKLKHDEYFREAYLKPALEQGFIEMTLPDKPTSSKQQYRLTEKGQLLLKKITDNDV